MPGLDTQAHNLPRFFNKGSYTVLTLTFIYVASGLCAVGLFAYLGYALIRAEKF
ncbi:MULTISPECIES: K(+)-transporting ATPase subunit F [Pseudomonas]|uniref:K(+)-transporting ATPase subunit F n=1 Tax=Pseudomonas TaxID=286 RepID=UPI0032EA2B1B